MRKRGQILSCLALICACGALAPAAQETSVKALVVDAFSYEGRADQAWIADGSCRRVEERLSSVKSGIVLLDREHFAKVLEELELALALGGQERAPELALASHLVFGKVVDAHGAAELSVRLIDARSGRVVLAASYPIGPDSVARASSFAASDIARALGVELAPVVLELENAARQRALVNAAALFRRLQFHEIDPKRASLAYDLAAVVRSIDDLPSIESGGELAYFRGIFLLQLGKKEDAAAAFESLVGTDWEALGRLGLADMARLSGRHAEALTLYSKVLEANPGDAAAIYGMAKSSMALRDFESGVGYLLRLMELRPGDRIAEALLSTVQIDRIPVGDARGLRAEVSVFKAFYKGSFDEARALSRNGTSGLYYRPFLEGYGEYQAGDLIGAFESFSKAAEANPAYARTYFYLGETCLSLGRRSEARRYYSAYLLMSRSASDFQYVRSRLIECGVGE